MEGLFIYYAQKNIKSAKWITTVYYCTVYTETTWSDFAESHQPHTKSHQLRTMNARSHINSVPWLYTVTSTPYQEWTRSHQLRIMNENGHTNSVPWMNAICRLR
jgi:hypothetical protein